MDLIAVFTNGPVFILLVHMRDSSSSGLSYIGDTQQLSYGAAVAITGVLCSVVSFTVGGLLGAFLLHLITRGRGKPPTTPHPPVASYEEVEVSTTAREVRGHREESIDLKSNEAYGPIDKRIITRPNQAYGQVQL